MESVFIVEAGVDYEGSSPVRAFDTKGEAENYARECAEHLLRRPKFPDYDPTHKEIQQWVATEEAWEAAHEAGLFGSSDWFQVVEVPFGPSSAAGKEGGGK